ncbi:hypothetical protein [Endozoicomonas acroporae]|uniref:hypothetical protein n=1 Tax=Endozoicomonas acroporae TaxID=1701104 RepID=UPI0013D1B8B7|nr:hypothetical protein [Endozoicomonas acroporae]
MNTLAQAGQQRMSSYDFWRQINQFRAEENEKAIEHSKFLARVIDEVGGVSKNFRHPQNGQLYKCVDLDKDQMLLVGMRESKAVRKKVLDWLKLLSAPVAQPVALPTSKELALMVLKAEEEKEAAQAEAKRLNQVCNTVTRQFIPGQTAARFCMQLNGVNCQQVQGWLASRGHLINEGRRGYRPSAETRDRYFKLYVADNGGRETYQAQLTQKGCRWLYNKYLKGELPMKKSWDEQFTHAVFEQCSAVSESITYSFAQGAANA